MPTATIILTPTLEPIPGGWSTFSDPDFGFQFQYPAAYDKGFKDIFEGDCGLYRTSGEDSLHITIGEVQIDLEKTDKNLADYTKNYIRNAKENHPWDVIETKTEINGMDAESLLVHRARGVDGNITIMLTSNEAIKISFFPANFIDCGPPDSGYSSYWVYDQILQTLIPVEH